MRFGRYIAYAFGVGYSLVLSYFVANSNYHNRIGSDLIAYDIFYDCLSSNEIDACRNIISSNYEFSFYFCFKLLSLAGFDFSSVLFIVSFFIYSSLSILVVRFSKDEYQLYWFALIFLFTDFRYYDYGFNIIRHGVASVAMLAVAAFFLVTRKKVKYILLFLPMSFHITAVAQLSLLAKPRFCYSRFFWFSLFFILSILIFSPAFSWIVATVYNINYLGDKLAYYLNSDRNLDWIPLQYFVILCFAFLLNIKEYYYLSFRQVFFALMSLSIIFYPFGMSYRFVAFAMPFSAILLTYQFGYIYSSLSNKSKYLLGAGAVFFMLIFCFLNVFKYYDFILGGLR